MSGRIFQNVVLQFKETTDRTIGVIDSEGTVIACSELTGIGKKWTKYVEPIACLLYTSPSPRDVEESRMPSSA